MPQRIRIRLLLALALILSSSACAFYNAAFNIYDDSALSEADSAILFTQDNLLVFAYQKHGLSAAETAIGNLNYKTKIPPGRYRLAVSYNNPGVGRSFVPVSLSLVAEKGKNYWVAHEQGFGTWSPYLADSEPESFYGLLEFWKKE